MRYGTQANYQGTHKLIGREHMETGSSQITK